MDPRIVDADVGQATATDTSRSQFLTTWQAGNDGAIKHSQRRVTDGCGFRTFQRWIRSVVLVVHVMCVCVQRLNARQQPSLKRAGRTVARSSCSIVVGAVAHDALLYMFRALRFYQPLVHFRDTMTTIM